PGPIRTRKPDIRPKIGELEFAICAEQDDPRLIVTFACVVRHQVKANAFGRGHAIFRARLSPFATGAHTATGAIWHVRPFLCLQNEATANQSGSTNQLSPAILYAHSRSAVISS